MKGGRCSVMEVAGAAPDRGGTGAGAARCLDVTPVRKPALPIKLRFKDHPELDLDLLYTRLGYVKSRIFDRLEWGSQIALF